MNMILVTGLMQKLFGSRSKVAANEQGFVSVWEFGKLMLNNLIMLI